MYGMSVYIEPEDILNKFSEEGRKRFNQCIFTDVVKDPYGGSVEINCLLFNSEDEAEKSEYISKLINIGRVKWKNLSTEPGSAQ
jgi:hypothetical protein